MTVFIALLRAVNVGGSGKLAMTELRALAEECGFGSVRSYIQSGNLVFTSGQAAAAASAALTTAIRERAGLDIDVLLRSRAELASLIERNPFLERGADAAKLHVLLTDSDPGKVGAGLDQYLPEEAAAGKRAVYLFLPDGVGRSKLAVTVGKRVPGTMRNWRTMTALLALADEVAAS
jgi:uncharacterized protein (DUF1697 family)